MIAFGVLLVVVGLGGGALLGWLALQTEGGITLGSTGFALTVLPISVYAAGALSVALIWLGVGVSRAGIRHRRSSRQELEELRQSQSRQSQLPPAADDAGPESHPRDNGPAT